METNNSQHINWEIVTAILDDSANETDREAFKSWISDEQNSLYYEEIKHTWEQTGDISYCFDEETNGAWEETSKRVFKDNTFKVRKLVFRAVQIAALFCIIFIASKHLFFPDKKELFTQNNIINDFKMPDNSLVSINRNSHIAFIKGFKGLKRKVWLEGEAFFDVEKNIQKPFVIKTNKGEFEVLGTSFNITCYEEDSELSLSVKTGKVRFTSPNNKFIIVKKGESIKYNINTNQILKNKKFNLNVLSWKTKQIVFDNMSLTEVAQVLESVYNVNINIEDDHVKTLKFSANFDHQPLDKILKVIALTFDIEIEYKNNMINFNQMN